jgi:prepilin-type N-terminal cleavage/methylation domain-containing protein
MLISSRSGARAGFTIAEMVVSVAILAIIGAIVVPNVNRYLYNQELQATVDMLDSLSRSRIAFVRTIGLTPGRLSQLTTPITITDNPSCNGIAPSQSASVYSSSHVNLWTGFTAPPVGGHSGPFFGRSIPFAGYPLPIGIVNDRIVRTTANLAAGFITFQIPNVTYADAIALNNMVDGGGTPGPSRTDTAGALRWSTTPTGTSDLVTLLWVMGGKNGC